MSCFDVSLIGHYRIVLQVLAQIDDKQRRLPEVRARQGGTANTSTLQRLMQSFEHDIQLLVTQVRPRPLSLYFTC